MGKIFEFIIMRTLVIFPAWKKVITPEGHFSVCMGSIGSWEPINFACKKNLYLLDNFSVCAWNSVDDKRHTILSKLSLSRVKRKEVLILIFWKKQHEMLRRLVNIGALLWTDRSQYNSLAVIFGTLSFLHYDRFCIILFKKSFYS